MKKKILKTVACLALASTTAFATACGGNKIPDGEQTLQIFVSDQGFGTNWAHKIVELFKEQDWVKAEYPDLEIIVNSNDQNTYAQTQLNAGKSANTFDLLFGNQLRSFNGSSEILDLTECVYNQKVPGEEVLYKDKINPGTRDSYAHYNLNDPNATAQYYQTPWQGGLSGILYNADLLAEYEIEVPRTTDELIAACKKITTLNADKGDSKKYAIIQSKEAPYWDMYLYPQLWAQYDTAEGVNNFYRGKDSEGAISRNIFTEYKGRVEVLEVFYDLFKFSEGNIHPYSFTQTFMVSQAAYLDGAAVFHVNGNYFDEEMKEDVATRKANGAKIYNIKMMKNPIISDLVEESVCASIAGENGGTADQELSALVKAIDNAIEQEKTKADIPLEGEGYKVDQAAMDRIIEARFTLGGGGGATGAVIPSYATGKEVAIDFLRFMATDIALDAYTETTLGTTLPFKYNVKKNNPDLYNSLSDMQKEIITYLNSTVSKTYGPLGKHAFPLSIYAELQPFITADYWTTFTSETNKKTPQDYYNETIQAWTEDKWNTAKANAGL